MLPGTIPGPGFSTSALMPPTVELADSGSIPKAVNSDLGTVNIGPESSSRQLILMTAGTYFPTGTVNEFFTLDDANDSVYRQSYRAANGLFLSAAFSSYTNRDAVMLSPVFPTGTTADISITHGDGNLKADGRYWLLSVSKLINKTAPVLTAWDVDNNYNLTVLPGAVITVLLAGSAGVSLNVGTKLGTTVNVDSYSWAVYVYINETGSSQNLTLTQSNGTWMFIHVWR